MTFRPSQRERLIYPVAIFLLILFMYVAFKYMATLELSGALSILLLILSTLLVQTVIASVRVWSSRVIVDEMGVHWSGGPLGSGSLDWGRIKRVAYDERPTPGSIEDVSGQRHSLPFLNDELMRVIDEQLDSPSRGS